MTLKKKKSLVAKALELALLLKQKHVSGKKKDSCEGMKSQEWMEIYLLLRSGLSFEKKIQILELIGHKQD